MLYLVHNDGRIHQANKVYDHKGYDGLLRDEGYSFVKVDTPKLYSLEDWHIVGGRPSRRPAMPVKVKDRIIKAGNNRAFMLRGVPIKANVTVFAGGLQIEQFEAPSSSIEIEPPCPGIFRVTIDRFPHQPWSIDLEAR